MRKGIIIRKVIGWLFVALPFLMFMLVPINQAMIVYGIAGIIGIFGFGLFMLTKDS